MEAECGEKKPGPALIPLLADSFFVYSRGRFQYNQIHTVPVGY